MNKAVTNVKRNILIGVLIIVVCLSLCFAFLYMIGLGWKEDGEPKELKSGFSDKLTDDLKTKLGITIPNDAEFIKGTQCFPFWSESSLIITFECPADDFDGLATGKNITEYIHKKLELNGELWESVDLPSKDIVTDQNQWANEYKYSFQIDTKNGLGLYSTLSYSLVSQKLKVRLFWGDAKGDYR